jgi:cytochrome P450
MPDFLEALDTDPHPVLRRLRETEPVSFVDDLNAWLVTRYDLADTVLKDYATFTVDDPRFTTARVTGPSMLSLDGAAHARHRNAFAGGLKPAALNDEFVSREVARLIAGFRADGRVELRRRFAGPLAAAVMANLLGLDEPAEVVLAWYDEIVSVVSGLAGSTEGGRYHTPSFGKLRDGIVRAVSGDRSALLTAAAGELATDEVVANAAVLLFGGIETTEGMIANAVAHMLEFGEPSVEESLRLEPAAAMVDRFATRDVELGGASIRRGDQVTVSITGANRDPAVFPDPDTYLPSRPNAVRHLAFAHGPHFCVGAHLARLETETALAAVRALPALRLDGAVRVRGVVFRKPAELRVAWRP